jgi:hypothetical protein
MYRVQFDSSNKWVFICKVCLEKLKPNNPHYKYGGTWKNKLFHYYLHYPKSIKKESPKLFVYSIRIKLY